MKQRPESGGIEKLPICKKDIMISKLKGNISSCDEFIFIKDGIIYMWDAFRDCVIYFDESTRHFVSTVFSNMLKESILSHVILDCSVYVLSDLDAELYSSYENIAIDFLKVISEEERASLKYDYSQYLVIA